MRFCQGETKTEPGVTRLWWMDVIDRVWNWYRSKLSVLFMLGFSKSYRWSPCRPSVVSVLTLTLVEVLEMTVGHSTPEGSSFEVTFLLYQWSRRGCGGPLTRTENPFVTVSRRARPRGRPWWTEIFGSRPTPNWACWRVECLSPFGWNKKWDWGSVYYSRETIRSTLLGPPGSPSYCYYFSRGSTARFICRFSFLPDWSMWSKVFIDTQTHWKHDHVQHWCVISLKV